MLWWTTPSSSAVAASGERRRPVTSAGRWPSTRSRSAPPPGAPSPGEHASPGPATFERPGHGTENGGPIGLTAAPSEFIVARAGPRDRCAREDNASVPEEGGADGRERAGGEGRRRSREVRLQAGAEARSPHVQLVRGGVQLHLAVDRHLHAVLPGPGGHGLLAVL